MASGLLCFSGTFFLPVGASHARRSVVCPLFAGSLVRVRCGRYSSAIIAVRFWCCCCGRAVSRRFPWFHRLHVLICRPVFVSCRRHLSRQCSGVAVHDGSVTFNFFFRNGLTLYSNTFLRATHAPTHAPTQPGHPAHGAAKRDRPEAALRGDPRVHDRHLHRQDRHPHH